MNSLVSRRSRTLVVATLLVSVAVWAARRPDQLLHPYVWVEEGAMIDLWQQLGVLRQAVSPVNGQLILSSSGVGVLASLDFLQFPVLAYVAASLWLLGTCLLQVTIYVTSRRSDQIVLVVGDVVQQSFANLGTYAFGWLRGAQFSYLVFVGVAATAAAVGLALYARPRTPSFALDWVLLLVVLAAFTVLSSMPAPKVSDPYVAGPRYYFLPFIGVSWLAVLSACGPWKPVRRVGAAVLAVSLVTLAPTWSRTHDAIDWRQQVLAVCGSNGDGRVPVHFDGSLARVWSVTVTPATCARVAGQT